MIRTLQQVRAWYRRRSVFAGTLALLGGSVLLLDVILPMVAQATTGGDHPLPIPRTLYRWYIGSTCLAIAIYVLSSNRARASFLSPLRAAAQGTSSKAEQWLFRAGLVVLPLLAGYTVYSQFVVDTDLPAVVRQQHPGMSSGNAAAYVGHSNPHRQPTKDLLEAFVTAYDGRPAPQDELDARPPKRDLSELSEAELTALYVDEAISEGRDLYFANCSVCHGAKLDGTGPAAAAWTLAPIDFREPGTIETLVEDAVLWRVSEGGLGLPPIATPWDSTMPRWSPDLTEDQRWKVIMAIYADAGVEPRVLELAHAGGEQ